jgi:type II secretion system protein H
VIEATATCAHLGVKSKCKQTGFTLLEILVVVLIIGIVSTMAGTLLLPGFDQRQLRIQLETLTDKLKLAQHRAILTGRPYGLMVDSTGYFFATYRQQQWTPSYEKGLEKMPLTGLYSVSNPLYAEDKNTHPVALMSPMGEPYQTHLVLKKDNIGWQLVQDATGNKQLNKWQPPNAQDE